MASFHTHRLDARKKSLEKTFSLPSMENVWTKYVRAGLRDQEVLDLHDYNDFHWARKQLFENLHASICSGSYAPLPSTPVRIEKKHGVSRTLVIPSPQDCVVLQCIVESMLDKVLEKQPLKNSFFSRSHGFSNPEWRFERDYIWFKRWATFSKLRFKIATAHNYICITDIANYFDNIDYSHLRNIISTVDGIDEVTLDILFAVLDKVSWRPDYLPSPGRSLPQVNFDAPRLLSHVYLFEIDEYLKNVSGNQFVRWVDDISIAATDASQAKKLLGDLDQLLMMRGLRLNSGKTQILSAKNARKFFHESENSYLDQEKARISKYVGKAYKISQIIKRVRGRFDKFSSSNPYGQYDKILKRYITTFSILKDSYAENYCLSALYTDPSIRESIFRYFSSLGHSRKIFNALREYMLGDHALDDSSIMQIARVFTEWDVPVNSPLHRDMRKLADTISTKDYSDKNPFFFLSALWIMAKYGRAKNIYQLIEINTKIWETSEFMSRQVASVYAKIFRISEGKKVRHLLEKHRFSSTISIFSSLDYAVENPNLSKDVRLYVLNGNSKTKYSIQRFLICFYVLSCPKIDWMVRRNLRNQVIGILTDPIYINVLNSIKK